MRRAQPLTEWRIHIMGVFVHNLPDIAEGEFLRYVW